MTKRIVLLALALAAACSSRPTTAASGPTGTPSVVPAPRPSATRPAPEPVPSFSTPEAAMVFLADAWNRGDLKDLKRVTNPSARELLWNMHREAVDLRLKSCTYDADAKDYSCLFTHGYPVGYQGARGKVGNAVFRVGPARRSGWYMTVYESCG